jgi:hypothetical protein
MPGFYYPGSDPKVPEWLSKIAEHAEVDHRLTKWLIRLTVAILALTAVLVVLTVILVAR